ncbi:hypothetical protein [Streptomyces sp. NPDC051684]|uniref:hypothetical protein n=1 Tax=Streptomyces sp. NPDC051684 TaxID=3365670 RepID=UPI00378A3B05
MEFVFFMTLPGLVIVLTLLTFVDQLLLRAGRAGVLPWRPGKDDGAPPNRTSVNLEGGTAVVRLPRAHG